METARLLSVGGDLLMAVETQGGLCFAPEWRVALVAALFILFMGLGQRPWHDQLLKYALGGCRVGGHTHPDCDQDGQKPAHNRGPSVKMNCNNVHDGGDDQHHKERQVQKVPK